MYNTENEPITPLTSPREASPFDWDQHVSAFSEEQAANLATKRGYSPEFVVWLRQQKIVGSVNGKVAFAVHGEDRTVIGCHVRKSTSWICMPNGNGTQPLIIGDNVNAQIIYAFESQWDAFAFMSAFNWHEQFPLNSAVIITRGATNQRLVAGKCQRSATVFAFTQNDAAGRGWYQGIAAHCGCPCFDVKTPKPHKDLNDWLKAGATRDDFQKAIDAAKAITPRAASAQMPTDSGRAGADDEAAQAVELQAEDPFPTDSLPPVLQSIVAAAAVALRVPESLVAMMALAILAGSIGKGLAFSWRAGLPPLFANIFVLLSAMSGSGKTLACKILSQPFSKFERSLQERWRTEVLPSLSAEHRVTEAQAKKLEVMASKAADEQAVAECKTRMCALLAKAAELKRQLTEPQLSIQDATVEKITTALMHNDETLFSISSDARKPIDNLLGRYSASKMADDNIYLCAYSGDDVKVDRQGRDSVRLVQPCLTVLWAVQPDALQLLVSEESLHHSGFLARCLVAHTNAEPQLIDGQEQGIATEILSSWESLIGELLVEYRCPQLSNQAAHVTGPQLIEASAGTRALFIKYYNESVLRCRSGELADVQSEASRWAEQASRIAVSFHAAAHGRVAHKHPLSAETAENAIKVAQWFARQQLMVLAKGRLAVADKIEAEVFHLLDVNRARKGQDFVTAREVQRQHIAKNAEAAQALLVRMVNEGKLIGKDHQGARGGAPSRRYYAVTCANVIPE